jgi:hypothetical protein
MGIRSIVKRESEQEQSIFDFKTCSTAWRRETITSKVSVCVCVWLFRNQDQDGGGAVVAAAEVRARSPALLRAGAGWLWLAQRGPPQRPRPRPSTSTSTPTPTPTLRPSGPGAHLSCPQRPTVSCGTGAGRHWLPCRSSHGQEAKHGSPAGSTPAVEDCRLTACTVHTVLRTVSTEYACMHVCTRDGHHDSY